MFISTPLTARPQTLPAAAEAGGPLQAKLCACSRSDFDQPGSLHEDADEACLLPQKPRGALQAKLCAYLRPKLHPVLLDGAINSPATVRLNLYQLARLAGAKFACLLQALCRQPQQPRCAPVHVGGRSKRLHAYADRL